MARPSETSVRLPAAERLGPRHWRVTDRAGRRYTLRTIRPSDAPALQRAFAAQDPADRMMRLRSAIPRLPDGMARAFCTVDESRDVCLVLVPEDAAETLAGGARVMRDRDGSSGEYAVSIASTLKGMGLGRLLLEIALDVAAEMGMTEVWGLVARRNAGMRQLAARLGMREEPSEERDSVITRLDPARRGER